MDEDVSEALGVRLRCATAKAKAARGKATADERAEGIEHGAWSRGHPAFAEATADERAEGVTGEITRRASAERLRARLPRKDYALGFRGKITR